ncbi:MAG: protease modulator HflC [Alphaproteobacteria bacterium]|nr:protease modulator HflC [Alphaproteobacteria bacterium]
MNRAVLTLAGIVLAALGVVGASTLFTVAEGRQALVLQLGEPVRVISEPGLRVKLPFVQNVVMMDKRILSFDAPKEELIAADQKRLVVDAFARFRIVDPLKFYQTVGNETVARSRLAAVINSGLRRILGQAPFAAILSGDRANLMRQISDLVNEEAKDLGIEVVDVRIKRADLPDANSQAIYRRMQADRDREAKEIRATGAEESQRIRSRAERERTVLLAEAQREAQVLRGQGDATAIAIFAEAFGKDIEFFSFYRSMLAYRETMSDKNTTMVLTPDSEFFRFFESLSGKGSVTKR